MKARAAWWLALCAAPALAAACPLAAGPNLVEQDGVQLAWQPEPAPIAVGRPFAVVVSTCPQQAALAAVDATMPEHRHGMNYRPSIRRLAPGRWRVEGLLWHMSGRWQWRFELRQEGALRVMRQDVVLP